MAVFEVGDNEASSKKGYLGWGEKIGTPTILDSDCGAGASIESKSLICRLCHSPKIPPLWFIRNRKSKIKNPKFI